MDYRSLMEGNCGQASSLEQLAAHVTRDNAHQENIGRTFRGYSEEMGQNAMAPQSFNMNELLVEMQNIETQRCPVPPIQPFSSTGVNRFSHDFGLPKYDIKPMPAEVQANLNFATPLPYSSRFFPIIPDNLLGKNKISPLIIGNNNNGYEIPDEEHFTNKDMLSDDSEFDSDEEEKEEEGVSNTSQKYLHYNGLRVKDVYGIADLDVNWTRVEFFYNFVENYVLHKSQCLYKKYRPDPTQIKNPGISICRTGFDKAVFTGTGECFHSRSNRCCDKMYSFEIDNLAKAMAMNEQHLDAITVAKHCISEQLNPNKYVFLLTELYIHEHCFYQACQTLFDWFKNHPDYRDIVPPFFEIDDKASTSIDKIQLQELQKMFIKAAQRRPFNPDFHVQTALAWLCHIDRDYRKSVDCYLSILNTKTEKPHSRRDYIHMGMSLANSLALMDKRDKAIDILHTLMYDKFLGIKATANIGLIYMYQKDYKKAATYLLDAISTKSEYLGYDGCDNSLTNLWAQLRLCCELMRRDDLCQALDENNKTMLFDNLYDITLFPVTNISNTTDRMRRTSIMAYFGDVKLRKYKDIIYLL